MAETKARSEGHRRKQGRALEDSMEPVPFHELRKNKLARTLYLTPSDYHYQATSTHICEGFADVDHDVTETVLENYEEDVEIDQEFDEEPAANNPSAEKDILVDEVVEQQNVDEQLSDDSEEMVVVPTSYAQQLQIEDGEETSRQVSGVHLRRGGSVDLEPKPPLPIQEWVHATTVQPSRHSLQNTSQASGVRLNARIQQPTKTEDECDESRVKELPLPELASNHLSDEASGYTALAQNLAEGNELYQELFQLRVVARKVEEESKEDVTGSRIQQPDEEISVDEENRLPPQDVIPEQETLWEPNESFDDWRYMAWPNNSPLPSRLSQPYDDLY